MVYDKADWNISSELKEYVDKLAMNKELSNEEKILLVLYFLYQY